jgi:hypothetical protein
MRECRKVRPSDKENITKYTMAEGPFLKTSVSKLSPGTQTDPVPTMPGSSWDVQLFAGFFRKVRMPVSQGHEKVKEKMDELT